MAQPPLAAWKRFQPAGGGEATYGVVTQLESAVMSAIPAIKGSRRRIANSSMGTSVMRHGISAAIGAKRLFFRALHRAYSQMQPCSGFTGLSSTKYAYHLGFRISHGLDCGATMDEIQTRRRIGSNPFFTSIVSRISGYFQPRRGRGWASYKLLISRGTASIRGWARYRVG